MRATACGAWKRATSAATLPRSSWVCWSLLPCSCGWWTDVQQSYLLTILTFLPAAGTLALLLLRGDDHVWIRRLAMTTAIVEFALSLLLFRGFDPHSAGFQWEEFHQWIPQPPIHYHLGIDGISLFLILLT